MRDKITAKVKVLQSQEQEKRAQDKARKLDLPYLDLKSISINWEDVGLLKKEIVQRNKTGVIVRIGKKIKLGTLNPKLAQEIIAKLKTKHFIAEIFIISEKSLQKILETYDDIPVESAKEEIIITKIKNLDELKDKLKDKTASDLLSLILGSALTERSSDVHFEPSEESVRIRFRIDGILRDITEISKNDYQMVLSRLKILAKLKLNITNIPQNGRLRIGSNDLDIDLRLSVLPGPHGESISLRLLDPRIMTLGLEELGLNKGHLEILKKELKRPNGMILVTGPTGSGKTTTLYACLMEIHQPGIKIITLEDPVEYRLGGIVQTQVSEEYSFSEGLKNILRQDPDVILVGEIRDQQTAATALNAALTGHLVFSTLHANNAKGAIPRLIDMGIKPEVIGPALNLVIAQRLIRRKNKGRIGIFEMIKVGENIKNIKIISSMYEDGLAKIKTGITSKEELNRVMSNNP